MKERETGYEHRAPKKRVKKVVNVIKTDNIKKDEQKKEKDEKISKENKPNIIILVDI